AGAPLPPPKEPFSPPTPDDLERWATAAGDPPPPAAPAPSTTPAIRALVTAADDAGRAHGARDPRTLARRLALVWALEQAWRAAGGLKSKWVGEAVPWYADLVPDLEGGLGPDHLGTLRARYRLTWWLADAGRIGETIARYQALVEDQTRVFGADSPETRRSREDLEFWIGYRRRVYKS
ncbi:MAG: hypothetical protein KDB35_20905, partial [Acidimicrobiales bacterium]|nr:hypothetical protein [Acidimicrobiales bacterium]